MPRLLSSFALIVLSSCLALNLIGVGQFCGDVDNFQQGDDDSQSSPAYDLPAVYPHDDHDDSEENHQLLSKMKRLPPTRIHRDNILPDFLIAVVGLESSGTTFVADTLANALGAYAKEGPETVNRDGSVRVQHLSLPSGYFRPNTTQFPHRFEPLDILPKYIPRRCIVNPNLPSRIVQRRPPRTSPPECEAFGPTLVQTPQRYFVNITSHIQWYRDQGVDARAVIVVRDPALHFHGILDLHNKNETSVYEQYKTGQALLKDAVKHTQPVLVSYETLMTLKKDYLMGIYKQLGIDSQFVPSFKNGNIKYVPTIPKIIQDYLHADGRLRTTLRSGKIYSNMEPSISDDPQKSNLEERVRRRKDQNK